MKGKTITPYNKRKDYDKYIREKAEELKDLCYEYDIPMFFTAAVKNSEKGTEYESAMVTENVKGLTLKNDHIADMAKVLNDFYVVRAIKPAEIMDFSNTGDMAMPDLSEYENED